MCVCVYVFVYVNKETMKAYDNDIYDEININQAKIYILTPVVYTYYISCV